jgi:hypothetical protein
LKEGRKKMEKKDQYEKAKKRVEAKIGFFIHLAVYFGVNIVLVIINLNTVPEYIWFKWPLLGWGIGLVFHGLSVFVFSKESSFKERMIKREMEKQG